MRCQEKCPHCGKQCRKELLPPANAIHKERHETEPPPGKKSGHGWKWNTVSKNCATIPPGIKVRCSICGFHTPVNEVTIVQ